MYMELRDDRSERISYDFDNYPIYVRKGLLSSYNGFAAQAHWHDDVELIAVSDGTMQYNINGEVITLRAGQGVFVNAKALHFGFSEEHNECEFICVLLHPLMLGFSPQAVHEFVTPLLSDQNVVYIKLQQDVTWQKTILDCIYEIYCAKNGIAAPLVISGLFFKIWANIYANNPLKAEVGQNVDLSLIRDIIGFIQRNYDKKLSLNDIAHAGYVGQSKCCKLFREYVGQTPFEYLTQYRLTKSLQLLQTSDKTVTEIASSVGFGGSSYFAEIFKKTYGKSPTEYRMLRN